MHASRDVVFSISCLHYFGDVLACAGPSARAPFPVVFSKRKILKNKYLTKAVGLVAVVIRPPTRCESRSRQCNPDIESPLCRSPPSRNIASDIDHSLLVHPRFPAPAPEEAEPLQGRVKEVKRYCKSHFSESLTAVMFCIFFTVRRVGRRERRPLAAQRHAGAMHPMIEINEILTGPIGPLMPTARLPGQVDGFSAHPPSVDLCVDR